MYEIHLDTIDSTNTYAKNHAGRFPREEIACVTAEEQTAGRGRYRRRWVSPKGVNIYATFAFWLCSNTLQLGTLSQVMASSFANLLIEQGFRPKIKWPNDIQLNGRKVCGILTETEFQNEKVLVLVGIGINVNLEAESASRIDQPATSLLIESGRRWDRTVLLKQLQNRFAKDLALFKQQGFGPFLERFNQLLAFKGESVRIFDGQQEWEGVCHSVAADGRLNLVLADQTLRAVSSGDVRSTDCGGDK